MAWDIEKKEPLELSEDENRDENMDVNKLIGFSENTLVQELPIRLPELKNIKSIAAGDNHVLALDANGKLYVWGSDEQGQLGHLRMARSDKQYLKPALFRQRNTFQLIGTGRNHSFTIQKKGQKCGDGARTTTARRELEMKRGSNGSLLLFRNFQRFPLTACQQKGSRGRILVPLPACQMEIRWCGDASNLM